MEKTGERRESARMPFVAEGFCQIPKIARKYGGTLRDISINGLFIELHERLDAGDKCDVDIVFQGEHSRLVIENVGGTIMRCEKDGVAIRFDERLEWFVLIPLYFRKVRNLPLQG